MAQKYGGRWEIVGNLGKGGQSDVFEAKDTASSSDQPLVALKRVKNPKRHARFQNEVTAIKTLNHPNVVKLIDHSALDAEADVPEKQYIVMPLAREGDLSKRVSLYKGNLDGTLIVARKIASALEHAHSKKIVHRDVKPQNILFPEQSNEVWLTDFGICFLRDAERPTEVGEVVGPWSFMAPELEHGGQLDVAASADIYSLGKLIYYMISGGTVVPREEMFSSPYSDLFASGGRYHLLDLLLRNMVCNVGVRMTNMANVIVELDRIIEWDRNSALTPVIPKTRAKLEAMRTSVLQSREVAAQNRANAQAQQEMEARVQSHFMSWLKAELEKMATEIADGGVIATCVQEVDEESKIDLRANGIRPICGIELVVSNISTKTNWAHALQIFFCTEFKVTVMQTVRNEPESIVVPEDRTVYIFPLYAIRTANQTGTTRGRRARFFLGERSNVLIPISGDSSQNRFARNMQRSQVAPVGRFVNSFPFSYWPGCEHTMREFIGVCFDKFVEGINRYKDEIFPPAS